MNETVKEPVKDIAVVNAEVLRLQREAAKDQTHWINDGLRAYFEERKRKLAEITKSHSK